MKFLNQYVDAKEKPYICIAIICGFISHFLYDLSGKAALIALFCPVNESVWEHLKLLFFPLLFVSVLESLRFRRNITQFFYDRFFSTLCAMGFTISLFYTYTGIIGCNFLIIDITIFLISILSAFVIAALCRRKQKKIPSQNLVFSMWIIFSLLFFIFTCFPPDIPLFFPVF